MSIKKIKVAIYDFTDCEGCQIKLLSLREKLLLLEKKVDIVNWRLMQEKFVSGRYDLTIIEGTPIHKHEIKLLKELRKESVFLLALGSCATLGGIPAIISKKDRKKWYEKIYGEKYKPVGIDALPLSAYVDVDFALHGCPIDEDELMRVLEEILSQKIPEERPYSVCLECKLANNECSLLKGEMCLGPTTQGGCKAVCVSGGMPCYGCFGIRDGANIKALIKLFEKNHTKEEIQRFISMFHSRTKEYDY